MNSKANVLPREVIDEFANMLERDATYKYDSPKETLPAIRMRPRAEANFAYLYTRADQHEAS